MVSKGRMMKQIMMSFVLIYSYLGNDDIKESYCLRSNFLSLMINMCSIGLWFTMKISYKYVLLLYINSMIVMVLVLLVL